MPDPKGKPSVCKRNSLRLLRARAGEGQAQEDFTACDRGRRRPSSERKQHALQQKPAAEPQGPPQELAGHWRGALLGRGGPEAGTTHAEES